MATLSSDDLKKQLLLLVSCNNQRDSAKQREILEAADKSLNSYIANIVEIEDYVELLHELKSNLYVENTGIRSLLLRFIRHSATNRANCEIIAVDNALVWEVIWSLERDQEFLLERMQALKLIEKISKIIPDLFPESFCRSLLAIASHRDDNMRRVCLEVLRELSLANCRVVSQANGLTYMLEAAMDPAMSSMTESIILSVLHLLNDHNTRLYMLPTLDLRVLIAPFTDFDSDEADLAGRLKVATTALKIIMRSWVGVSIFTSDHLGLGTLVAMLKDRKVSTNVQGAILEAFSQIIEPFAFRFRQGGGSSGTFKSSSVAAISSSSITSSNSSERGYAKYSRILALETAHGAAADNKILVPKGKSMGDISKKSNPITSVFRRSSLTENGGSSSQMAPSAVGKTSSSGSPATTSDRGSSTFSSIHESGGGGGVSGYIFRSALHAAAAPFASPLMKKRQPQGPGYGGSSMKTPAPTPLLPKAHESEAAPYTPSDPNEKLSATLAAFASIGLSDFDPIYNVMDSYGAFLCCAFIHAGLVDSICVLGTCPDADLARKARVFLLDFFGIVSNLFPESFCSDLLTLPVLVELATLPLTRGFSGGGDHKASQILLSLARAFSRSQEVGDVCFSDIGGHSSGSSDAVAESLIPRMPSSGQLQQQQQQLPPLERTRSASNPSLSTLVSSSAPFPQSAFGTSQTGSVDTLAFGVGGSQAPGAWSSKTNTTQGSPAAVSVSAVSKYSSIKSIGDLAADIKILHREVTHRGQSSHAASVAFYRSTENHVASDLRELLQDIAVKLDQSTDKIDFKKQMELSKVLGKEGKEPFRWDWHIIQDILKYGFQGNANDSARLAEALENKWIKRVQGFFRCSLDHEKGYFPDLEHDPAHSLYVDVICELYYLLLLDDRGIYFLKTDQRGLVLTEISREVKSLVEHCGQGWSSSVSPTPSLSNSSSRSNSTNFVGQGQSAVIHISASASVTAAVGSNAMISPSFSAAGSASRRGIFRFHSTTHSMVVEYFTLVGQICHTESGKHLLENCTLFSHLLVLGGLRPLDYFSRTLIAALSFTDGGHLSKHLIRIWTSHSECSDYLRDFIHTLLLALLRTRPVEFLSWGKDCLLDQWKAAKGSPSLLLTRIFREAFEDPFLLRLMVPKLVNLHGFTKDQHLQIRAASCGEGYRLLESHDLLEPLICEWQGQVQQLPSAQSVPRGLQYVTDVDSALAKSLNISYDHASLSSLGSIPIACTVASRASPSSPSLSAPRDFHSFGVVNGPTLGGLPPDIEGLLRVPWNIETKLVVPSSSSSSSKATVEYLRIDAFLDVSATAWPLRCSRRAYTQARTLLVRGLVLDKNGLPTGHPIASNRTMASTLIAGVSPVTRNGEIRPISYERERRNGRRSTSATTKDGGNSTNHGPLSSSADGANGDNASHDSSYSMGDLPITFNLEHLFDWSYCRPANRLGKVTGLGAGRFRVDIPGEPASWILSETLPQPHDTPKATTGISGTADTMMMLLYRDNGLEEDEEKAPMVQLPTNPLYFVEIQYRLHVESPSAPVFVPLPRHFFGELSRTLLGCELLAQRGVIDSCLTVVRNEAADPLRRRAAMWSLAHIGSTDFGCDAVLGADVNFIDWCVTYLTKGTRRCNYSLRGVIFSALGLLSRSKRGYRHIGRLQWDSAPIGKTTAVSVPRDHGSLFQRDLKGAGAAYSEQDAVLALSRSFDSDEDNVSGVAGASMRANLVGNHQHDIAMDALDSHETEVINIISKMPGVIMYAECKSRLHRIRSRRPDLFERRPLFVAVRRVLDSYTFKLTARRDVVALFSAHARHCGSDGTTSNTTEVDVAAAAAVATAGDADLKFLPPE